MFALISGLLVLDFGAVEAAPAAPPAPPPAPRRPSRDELLAGLDLQQRTRVDQRFVVPLEGDKQAVLTLDPDLDTFMKQLLERYEVPYGGVVAVEPQTGKLLAYVSHSSAEPAARDHVRDASPPAASLFKLVTSAALLEHGVVPETSTCYHGGASGLTMAELVDNPKLDTACLSFSQALGWSVNAVFGKLALQRLDPKTLGRYAGAFGFGEALPFDLPTQPSVIDIPTSQVEFARTAAGFWHMRLSPLHAAMMAATIANQGKMMRPLLVDRVLDQKGKTVLKSEPVVHRSVLERRTADQIARMMRLTVTSGTAKKFFFDDHGNPFLPGVEVAAKTGTLSKERPYRGYTWWVGFAPASAPKIAVAALVVNSPKWRIKAGYVGREALRHYLFTKRSKSAGSAALSQKP
jgi:cell division protein FtsI/penicillin-binding protein 2